MNVGTSGTEKDFLNALFFPALPPIDTFTVDNPTREVGSTTAYTLTWGVTKQTNPITAITVDGTVIVPTGDTQSGTQTGNFTAAAGSFVKTMTASDGTNNVTATATVNYLNPIYYGTSAVNTLDNAGILALANKNLVISFGMTLNNFGGDGKYLVFVIPQSFGVPSFLVNGLTSTAFTVTPLNTFVNQYGVNIPVNVIVSNTVQNSPANYTLQ